MITIGITGQSGFIGYHLYNTLGLYPDLYTRIEFEDNYFDDLSELTAFVKKCDVIVHLAALNRHKDPQVIYETNIILVKKLIQTCELTESKPYIIYSSSTHENINNPYGISKKEGGELFESWAKRNHSRFTNLVIPNVFGPFGKPFYNSVISTFCYQLTHGETPEIYKDNQIKLIYVGELISELIHIISDADYPSIKSNQLNSFGQDTFFEPQKVSNKIMIPYSSEKKVSEILEILESFRKSYLENGIIPELRDRMEINLFNTFRSYIDIKQHNPVILRINKDERGSFVETLKTNLGGQSSFSTTKSGITRGNHFHTRKIERFTVIFGKARIQLRKIGTTEVLDFYLSGEKPAYVDIPIWYSHNILNAGDEDLYTLFWTNEFFDKEDQDTFFEKV